MVVGIDVFKAAFAGFEDRYTLIEGAAAEILMTGAGLPFRPTKDLDLVLCLEALKPEFVQTFWAFIDAGGYQAESAATARGISSGSPKDEIHLAVTVERSDKIANFLLPVRDPAVTSALYRREPCAEDAGSSRIGSRSKLPSDARLGRWRSSTLGRRR